jgi:hypothetical protein
MRAHLTSLFLSLVYASPAIDPIRVRLEAESAEWFRGVWISGIVVAIGCGLETWEVALDLGNWWRHRKKRDLLGDAPGSWRYPMAALGLFLVVGGIVGETVFEVLDANIESQIREHGSDITSDAETKAAEANKAAGEATDRATKAASGNIQLGLELARQKSRAAAAERALESEKTDRLKLEALVSPRRLTVDEQRQIGAKCAYFKANNSPYRRIIVESYGMDAEGKTLATQITSSLVSARLYNESRYGNTVQAGDFDTGVLISAAPEDEQFASCFANALTTIGHLKEVKVNPDRHAGGAMMAGGAVVLGGASMNGGGQIIRGAPLPAGSPIDIMVAIKPIETTSPGS